MCSTSGFLSECVWPQLGAPIVFFSHFQLSSLRPRAARSRGVCFPWSPPDPGYFVAHSWGSKIFASEELTEMKNVFRMDARVPWKAVLILCSCRGPFPTGHCDEVGVLISLLPFYSCFSLDRQEEGGERERGKTSLETFLLLVLRAIDGKLNPSLLFRWHVRQTLYCWNPIHPLNTRAADLDLLFPSADHCGLHGRQGRGVGGRAKKEPEWGGGGEKEGGGGALSLRTSPSPARFQIIN